VVKFYMGDPVRRILKRGIAAFCSKGLDFRMWALHDMDDTTDEKRRRFLDKVRVAAASL
jgi:NAD(P)H dehydrogenase (quinone)